MPFTKPRVPSTVNSNYNLRSNIRKKYNIPSYLLTTDVINWCSPKHVVRHIPAEVVLKKEWSTVWSAYIAAFAQLQNEDKFPGAMRTYIGQCHQYLMQSRPRHAFEAAYAEQKASYEDAEMERRVMRAQNRAEKEGEVFGAELTVEGINKHRKRVRDEYSNQVLQEDIRDKQGSNVIDETAENDVGSDEESVGDVLNLPLPDPFQDGEDEANELRLLRNNKVYMIQTPGNNLRSPHKPKLEEADIGTLSRYFDVRISSSRKDHASEETEEIYQENMKSGQRNASLKSLDKAFEFCAAACNQEQEGFPKWLWNYETESKDSKFLEMMKYTLTDFHLNCLVKTSAVNDERTPFVESVIPPLKAYSKVLDMLTFIWCERAMSARKYVVFRTAEASSKLADGIGRVPGTDHDMLLIESSGCNTSEDMRHTIDDTIKQLESTSKALKQQINTYKSASYQTLLKRKIYGIQVVQHTITLTETSIVDRKKWRFLEVRSAMIPTTWVKRKQWTKVFELIATLHTLLMVQTKVTEQLEAEISGLTEVAEQETVRAMLD